MKEKKNAKENPNKHSCKNLSWNGRMYADCSKSQRLVSYESGKNDVA